jgi:hypothetical protein
MIWIKLNIYSMSCQLLIIKQVRPNVNVPFYTAPESVKSALRTYGPPAVVGERNFADGLIRIRTLLFPSVEDYQNWLSNPVTSLNVKDRMIYNNKNGIRETHNAIGLEDYDILNIES